MKRTTRTARLIVCLLALGAALPVAVRAADGPAEPAPAYLYKTTFLRAAPGKLLDLIALLKGRMAVLDAAGDERPLWWRHTQGDQWDLMLLLPMGSYAEYYAPARVARRAEAADGFQEKLDACVSWKEDLFVKGPGLDAVKKAFAGGAYYHIEIMAALPGKQAELYKERRGESDYQAATGRPALMIFVRDQGAGWDIYTLGCYRDLAHWAESPKLLKEERDTAARKAGFNSADAIGPYMRTLIDMHRDTMGVAIK
ncbi:MAG: hypothetical protein NTZ26_13955 [Candidatus Aminicenantes bacterium]|nr:hypothetical protein [Candidatus Aminicenantes bacterium]